MLNNKNIVLSLFMLVSAALWANVSNACSPADVCRDIRFCAYEKLTDLSPLLVQALNADDPSQIEGVTRLCQNSEPDGSKRWSQVSGGCKPNEFVDIGRLARTNSCATPPPPPPEPPKKKCGICFTSKGKCTVPLQEQGMGCSCGGDSGQIICQ